VPNLKLVGSSGGGDTITVNGVGATQNGEAITIDTGSATHDIDDIAYAGTYDGYHTGSAYGPM
jgi:hypothetical protein